MDVHRRLRYVASGLSSLFDVIVNRAGCASLVDEGINGHTHSNSPLTMTKTTRPLEGHPAFIKIAAEDVSLKGDEEDLTAGIERRIQSLPNLFGTEHEGLHWAPRPGLAGSVHPLLLMGKVYRTEVV